MNLPMQSVKIVVLLGIFFPVCNAMELSNQNYRFFTNDSKFCSISADNFNVLKNQSLTIKEFSHNLNDDENVIQLPFSSDQLNIVLKLSRIISEGQNTNKKLNTCFDTYDPNELIEIIKNASYLKIQKLLNHSTRALIDRIPKFTPSICEECDTLPGEIKQDLTETILSPINNIVEAQEVMQHYVTIQRPSATQQQISSFQELLRPADYMSVNSLIDLATDNSAPYLLDNSEQYFSDHNAKSAETPDNLWSVAILPNNKLAISNIHDASFEIRHNRKNDITDVVSSQDGRFLAVTYSSNNDIEIFDILNPEDIGYYEVYHTGPERISQQVISLLSSPDNNFVAVALRQSVPTPIEQGCPYFRPLQILDFKKGKTYFALSGCNNEISCLAFSPDSKSLAVGKQTELYIFNTDNPEKPYYANEMQDECKNMRYNEHTLDNEHRLEITDTKNNLYTFTIPTFSQTFKTIPVTMAVICKGLYDNKQTTLALEKHPAYNQLFNALPDPLKQNLIKNNKVTGNTDIQPLQKKALWLPGNLPYSFQQEGGMREVPNKELQGEIPTGIQSRFYVEAARNEFYGKKLTLNAIFEKYPFLEGLLNNLLQRDPGSSSDLEQTLSDNPMLALHLPDCITIMKLPKQLQYTLPPLLFQIGDRGAATRTRLTTGNPIRFSDRSYQSLQTAFEYLPQDLQREFVENNYVTVTPEYRRKLFGGNENSIQKVAKKRAQYR